MHMYTTESESRAGLYSNNNIDIPLQSVNVKAAFSNLFCETTLTQTYLNSEKKPIEAIYTFPLSPRAVLLGLEVTIGERKLQGLIVEKNSAEEQYDIMSENRFQLEMKITGTLTQAEFACPSHNITISKSDKETTIQLATGEACMDRDFIINICQPQDNKDSILVEHISNGGYTALASFVPRIISPEQIPQKSIKIVVDCSGSMNGDSITQARQAISDILSQLRPDDFFNLITFGNSSKTLFKQQVQANKTNLTTVRRTLRSIEADMGGTDIQQALETTIQIPGPSIPQDILLITDGEVWESDEIIKTARKSRHRFFTVGVGSSVSENFVRQLADETGGACELVAPREQMSDKIVRHFERIYLPRVQKATINWPISPVKNIPLKIGSLYDGDTLHAFAFFDEMPQGTTTLEMTLTNGQTFSQSATIDTQANPIWMLDFAVDKPLSKSTNCNSKPPRLNLSESAINFTPSAFAKIWKL
ncbi:VWA domain-containing protein [bacterium]|nr:VWA domain-containing protein [bacterium]